MDPAGSEDDSDDLFEKLDSLLHRQDAPGAQQVPAELVPMLTEAVETPTPPADPDVPILLDAVESEVPHSAPAVALDQLRLLQAALYLRLRQSIDQALQDAALRDLPATQRAQFSQALRSALPRIVRESVEQAFGHENEPGK